MPFQWKITSLEETSYPCLLEQRKTELKLTIAPSSFSNLWKNTFRILETRYVIDLFNNHLNQAILNLYHSCLTDYNNIAICSRVYQGTFFNIFENIFSLLSNFNISLFLCYVYIWASHHLMLGALIFLSSEFNWSIAFIFFIWLFYWSFNLSTTQR